MGSRLSVPQPANGGQRPLLLSVAEAAATMMVPPRQLYNMISHKSFGAQQDLIVCRVGRTIVLRRAPLERWLGIDGDGTDGGSG